MHDVEFATPSGPDEIEAKLKAGIMTKIYTADKRYGTLSFRDALLDTMIDMTSFRIQQYSSYCRKPAVLFVGDLQSDLARRDFSINSLAMDSEGKVYDFHGGLEDIMHHRLRCTHSASESFLNDPLRILRAIRLGVKFDLTFTPDVDEAICKNTYLLLTVSKELISKEIDAINAECAIHHAQQESARFQSNIDHFNAALTLEKMNDLSILSVLFSEWTEQTFDKCSVFGLLHHYSGDIWLVVFKMIAHAKMTRMKLQSTANKFVCDVLIQKYALLCKFSNKLTDALNLKLAMQFSSTITYVNLSRFDLISLRARAASRCPPHDQMRAISINLQISSFCDSLSANF